MSNESSVYYQIALPVPLRRLFDYLPPLEHTPGEIIPRGSRVKVPFGKQERIGIVLQHSHTTTIPAEQLKPITEVCDPFALYPTELCDLIEKSARYYHYPIGEVIFTGAPLPLRQGKSATLAETVPAAITSTENLVLNTEQARALAAILSAQNQFHTFLLQGITGSGKTEVYLQAAAHLVAEQQQALILVPEISLTPQTYTRFQERFGDTVIFYHSRMTPVQRWKAWLKVRNGEARMVIGTRSAVFLPFKALGLIVIDEEHDISFKQQEGFRYSARDVAILRAQQVKCPIVLGSATPAFETLYNAQTQKYTHLKLSTRATATTLPEMTQVDIRHKKLEGGLSAALLHEIEQHIAAQGQVLLFINRRGFAPTFMCYGCGWIAQCERCDARLTFHHQSGLLICHHCTHQRKTPTQCPSCKNTDLNPVGQGTERIESVLQRRFPNATLARIDSDMTRKKGSLEALLEVAQNKDVQLLIGTQILAKGHHFPHLTLVAIVDADGGLFSVDFRAVERMAQLIIQVAGRAGRVHAAGKVLLQTLHPLHPLLQQILRQDYTQFAQELLEERKLCHLPPFSHFALLRAQASRSQHAEALLKAVLHYLHPAKPSEVSLLGPVEAPMLKRQGEYRYQLLIQSSQRAPLHHLLHHATAFLEKSPLAKKVRWSLDIDPLEMF